MTRFRPPPPYTFMTFKLGLLLVLMMSAPSSLAATRQAHSAQENNKRDHTVTQMARHGDYDRNERIDRHRSHDRYERDQRHRHNSNHHRDDYRDYHPRRHRHRHHYSRSYNSPIGISFSFGNSPYSFYPWAPHAYSFYRPAYGKYAHYRRKTHCRRMTVRGWQYGHRQWVNVKICSNPWDGEYIVQGSERVVNHRW